MTLAPEGARTYQRKKSLSRAAVFTQAVDAISQTTRGACTPTQKLVARLKPARVRQIGISFVDSRAF
jgi:hypothetical protein